MNILIATLIRVQCPLFNQKELRAVIIKYVKAEISRNFHFQSYIRVCDVECILYNPYMSRFSLINVLRNIYCERHILYLSWHVGIFKAFRWKTPVPICDRSSTRMQLQCFNLINFLINRISPFLSLAIHCSLLVRCCFLYWFFKTFNIGCLFIVIVYHSVLDF